MKSPNLVHADYFTFEWLFGNLSWTPNDSIERKKNSKLISSPVNINYLSFDLHLVQIWWNEHCDSDWLDFDWIEMMQHSMDCITAILKSKTTSSKLPTHVTERWLINYSHRFFNIQTDILLNSDFAYVYCAFVMATCTYSLPPNFPLFN